MAKKSSDTDAKRRSNKSKAPIERNNIIHSPLRTEIAHPRDAARLQESLRKKHKLDTVYRAVDETRKSLDALHDNHKPAEVKVSEVLAKHARHKHYDRLMNRQSLPSRKNHALTIVLGALVGLSAILYLLKLSQSNQPGSALSTAAAAQGSALGLNISIAYLVLFLIALILLLVTLEKRMR